MSEALPEEREAFRLSREVPISEGKTPADFSEDLVAVISGPSVSNTVKRELLTSMQGISTETYVDALKCFTNPLEKFDFSKITMPVLLMTGEHDKLAPPDEIRGVAKRIFETAPEPDVRFECVAGAGHVCNLENPNAYSSALVEFIMRVVK
jgi:pimeloyl-ACP methyl ester carboxylesterase